MFKCNKKLIIKYSIHHNKYELYEHLVKAVMVSNPQGGSHVVHRAIRNTC